MKKAIRTIYKLLPFKRGVLGIVKTFWRPSQSVYKHLHFHGDFTVGVTDASFQMRHYGFELENEIYWAGLEGGWEKTSVGLWTRLVRDADVIFDIGANTGVYSLISKSLNPDAQVYALEPIRRVFEKLEVNNRLNGYDIVCLEVAASDSEGTATVYDTISEHVYSVTVNKNMAALDVEVIPTEIRIGRLDNIIDRYNLDRLDLIKIDVETHEPEVLEGMGEYLDRFKPTMLIEILNDDVGRRVEEIVKDIGYLYFNIDEESDSIRRVSSITKSDYYNYLLCSEEVAKNLSLIS